MAGVLMKWEFLESDGNTLFDVIKVLNQRFDIEHEKTRKKSNAKQKETNAWNKQIKAQKASKDIPPSVLQDSEKISSEVLPQIPGPSSESQLYQGIENTSPNIPKKPKKQKPIKQNGEAQKKIQSS
ncbi:hypothetical protein NLI96_g13045 [Meripilus lineatus]|uniref:Uncharacterized protein n=1 Tax=Meripilus lineatus TaxID=2056292 RepID=A0AAD5Y9A9_9APHY|nr:hypothetical protein NLI96_g13045 [Physisporinus lineatus]